MVTFEIPAETGTRDFTELSDVHIVGHASTPPNFTLGEIPNNPKLEPVIFTRMDPVKGPFCGDIWVIREMRKFTTEYALPNETMET